MLFALDGREDADHLLLKPVSEGWISAPSVVPGGPNAITAERARTCVLSSRTGMTQSSETEMFRSLWKPAVQKLFRMRESYRKMFNECRARQIAKNFPLCELARCGRHYGRNGARP